eukprot:TRINITY_DN1517_c4_g1_i1.p1 TRINITY_DN1517_c4_g1~~TRINITY_DN1517_c4_g1_i1.p1  ORF type:complete len:574 (+),score=58.78 TRINITY_DN1517_c4_g1_i1:465-2186(+)
MGTKVAATCFNWSQPVVPQSPPSSQTLASAISSPSSRRRITKDLYLSSRFITRSSQSPLFLRSRSSCEKPRTRGQSLRRSCSACLDSFPDEEFAKKLQEIALRFQLSDEENIALDAESESDLYDSRNMEDETSIPIINEELSRTSGNFPSVHNPLGFSPSNSIEAPWLGIRPEPPDWPENEIIPANVERKANSIDLPFSLRIIKRKKQWQEGFREVGESTYCSVKKAFSSMVFIIRELQSYTLQMREVLFYEDLQGILVRVQKEMNASFVWLFQQIFSHTPTLMVSVMILLANFTVYSLSHNTAIATMKPPESYTMETETVQVTENRVQPKFDPLSVKTFSVGKTASIGENGGGGGKARPVAGATDGEDGRIEGSSSDQHRTILPDEVSPVSSFGNPATKEGESVVGVEEEEKVWNSVVEEVSKMQVSLRDESLDHETMQRFVSPVSVEIEAEDYEAYFKTELLYQQAISQEPQNPLLLSNYAQFLYLVVHDHDRAEEYFKRAVRIEPPDAESLSRYANFLWLARKDLVAAEDAYIEATSADPGNTFHAANYAHFLWNTGGEDTCFPLSGCDA